MYIQLALGSTSLAACTAKYEPTNDDDNDTFLKITNSGTLIMQ